MFRRSTVQEQVSWNRKRKAFFDAPRCSGGCCRRCPVAAAGDHGPDSMQGRFVSLGCMHASSRILHIPL